MDESTIATVPAIWAPAAAAILGVFALYAAGVDRVLAAPRGAHLSAAASPVHETARLLRQRRRVPVKADELLWRAGAYGMLVAALLMITVVPLGSWTLFDLDVGIVWFNAMDVMIWALVWLTGWGANSAYGLVGGYRFLAHGLGYELPLMFALVAPAIAAESLRVTDVVAAQQGLWYVVWMPVAFLVYCLTVTAFSVWGPFAAAAGRDLAGGVTAELSGVDRMLFQGGRLALLAAGAAFAVPMFLGGGAGPLLPDWLWVLVKTTIVLTALVWLRHRLPILRPDKFMEIGWVIALPLVLIQDLVVAVIAAGKG